MFDSLGFETLTAPQAAVWLAILIGVTFGILAQITRFCFRRSLVGADRKQAMGVWMTALAVAVLGTQGAVAAGWISFANHRFMSTELPALAIVIGGLMFGAGMVLTRGCISRLSVLTGSGNLRAALVLVVFAVIAQATLRGVLSPLRLSLGSITLSLDSVALPGPPLLWAGLIAVVALTVALRSGNRATMLALAAMLGALVPLAWVGTGYILLDDFDPIAMESLSFTSAGSDALFFIVASSAISATFGAGLIAVVALTVALRSGNRATMLALAAMLGALVPLAWVGTGYILLDDFDPIAMESLSFTSAGSDALFFIVASSAISATFGAGLIGAVVLGGLISSLIRREFMWESFHSPRETGRYMSGAALMGVGGVLAGGCTVGAGLSGVPTLSLAAILAIAAIAAGGLLAHRLLNAGSSGRAAPATRPATSQAK